MSLIVDPKVVFSIQQLIFFWCVPDDVFVSVGFVNITFQDGSFNIGLRHQHPGMSDRKGILENTPIKFTPKGLRATSGRSKARLLRGVHREAEPLRKSRGLGVRGRMSRAANISWGESLLLCIRSRGCFYVPGTRGALVGERMATRVWPWAPCCKRTT